MPCGSCHTFSHTSFGYIFPYSDDDVRSVCVCVCVYCCTILMHKYVKLSSCGLFRPNPPSPIPLCPPVQWLVTCCPLSHPPFHSPSRISTLTEYSFHTRRRLLLLHLCHSHRHLHRRHGLLSYFRSSRSISRLVRFVSMVSSPNCSIRFPVPSTFLFISSNFCKRRRSRECLCISISFILHVLRTLAGLQLNL